MDVPLRSHRPGRDRSLPRRIRAATTAATLLALAFGFSATEAIAPLQPGKGTMQLTSTAFKEGQPIPTRYTSDGKNVSPPLQWSGVPAGAKSLALIADDPDAPVGVWVHWVVYDLPPTTTELSEDLPKSQYLSNGARQGLNDFKHLGYGGPQPPPGKAHRYFFKLYALDKLLDLKPGAMKKDVESAMAQHILAQTHLMGVYQRK
jgi:Raf kinase inhibitor-like YbhB/YbcL family protein